MNWLEFYDASVKGREQGWIKISATTGDHPYAGAYWPAGHIIGYEHTFINEASDILTAIGSDQVWQELLAVLESLSPFLQSHESRAARCEIRDGTLNVSGR